MAEKKIAVLVSGGGTNLQALIDAQGRGELGGGVLSAVISSRADAYALERARLALGETLRRAEEERARQGRMYGVLGLTAGAFLVIMLI